MARAVLITGLSGSGKTTALRALEDVGYFAMDNLPVVLLPKVVELASGYEGSAKIAGVIDVREKRIDQAGGVIDELIADGVQLDLVYLHATPDVLVKRFRETRRRHPLEQDGNLRAAIDEERRLLFALHERATVTIDTTGLNVHQLKDLLQDRFGSADDRGLAIRVVSFGFKHGPLVDADLLFDVRFLANPHFVPELRYHSGLESDVAAYVRGAADTAEFEGKLDDMLNFLVPRYVAEGKVYLTIGIGCTGGQHRSVAISEALARRLRESGLDATTMHRDRPYWKLKSP